MFDGNRYTCDAETSRRVAGHATAITWHRCGTRAYSEIRTQSGSALHYCNQHRERIVLGKYVGFKPAPGAEWRAVS